MLCIAHIFLFWFANICICKDSIEYFTIAPISVFDHFLGLFFCLISVNFSKYNLLFQVCKSSSVAAFVVIFHFFFINIFYLFNNTAIVLILSPLQLTSYILHYCMKSCLAEDEKKAREVVGLARITLSHL